MGNCMALSRDFMFRCSGAVHGATLDGNRSGVDAAASKSAWQLPLSTSHQIRNVKKRTVH